MDRVNMAILACKRCSTLYDKWWCNNINSGIFVGQFSYCCVYPAYFFYLCIVFVNMACTRRIFFWRMMVHWSTFCGGKPMGQMVNTAFATTKIQTIWLLSCVCICIFVGIFSFLCICIVLLSLLWRKASRPNGKHCFWKHLLSIWFLCLYLYLYFYFPFSCICIALLNLLWRKARRPNSKQGFCKSSSINFIAWNRYWSFKIL